VVLDMSEYTHIVKNLNINIIYSGPMWNDGIKGLAEMVKVHLSNDSLSSSANKAIFSVFVEQVTNMLMYSAEKDKIADVSMGMLILGNKEDSFFIQTRNAVKSENVDKLKSTIDYLNTLDKNQLRQFHKERLQSENENLESQGAGLGLIEIARRATSPIAYKFEPIDDSEEKKSCFTMYVEIARREGGVE